MPASALAALQPASSHPLTPQEGKVIVTAALQHRQQMRRRLDCSHLVHAVYRFAGLGYPYATSYQLFAGVENFARVETPQPGDLVVWQGHVGIVVDPDQHSFYSTRSSGPGIAAYDSRYWRGRGPVRFYRYLRATTMTLAVATRAEPRTSTTPVQVLTVPVIDETTQATQPATRPAGSAPVVPRTAPSATVEIPSYIPVASEGSKPKKEEVAEAISELSNALAQVLRGGEVLRPGQPVVIVERFRVKKVKTKKGRGWVEVEIESRVSIAPQEIKLKRRKEKRRWELSRTESGWVAFPPLERAYVSRDVAVSILAEQLAILTRQDAEVDAPDPDALSHQQAQLARVLNALLGKK
ncbi:MAG: NlpC/P60 family protein [Terriglobia bacterium]